MAGQIAQFGSIAEGLIRDGNIIRNTLRNNQAAQSALTDQEKLAMERSARFLVEFGELAKKLRKGKDKPKPPSKGG